MSFVLSLETQTGLSEAQLLEAACACGAVPTVGSPAGRLAVFPSSGLEVLARTSFDSPRVLTEGLESPIHWDVGMRVSLVYAPEKYDECNRDVRCLLERVAMQSQSNFVLSFQNETVYAIRDQNGLRFNAEGITV